jgi:hypothetical protein
VAQVPRESQQVIGGEVGEGRHAGARIATLQIGAQLLDRLCRDPRIHDESRRPRRAAGLVAVTGGAARGEQRRSRRRLRRQRQQEERWGDHGATISQHLNQTDGNNNENRGSREANMKSRMTTVLLARTIH